MLAVVSYHDKHGHYPPAYRTDASGRPAHSWRVQLLPYLEHRELEKAYTLSESWDGPGNRALAGRMPTQYAFHGVHEPGHTTTNYLAVVGTETAWPGSATLTAKDIKDGTSNTILVVENRGAGVHWMEPRDLAFATMSFEVGSTAGVSSLYADPAVAALDGSVFRLSNVSPEVLRALLTAAGGEVVGPDADGWSVLPDGRQRERASPK